MVEGLFAAGMSNHSFRNCRCSHQWWEHSKIRGAGTGLYACDICYCESHEAWYSRGIQISQRNKARYTKNSTRGG